MLSLLLCFLLVGPGLASTWPVKRNETATDGKNLITGYFQVNMLSTANITLHLPIRTGAQICISEYINLPAANPDKNAEVSPDYDHKNCLYYFPVYAQSVSYVLPQLRATNYSYGVAFSLATYYSSYSPVIFTITGATCPFRPQQVSNGTACLITEALIDQQNRTIDNTRPHYFSFGVADTHTTKAFISSLKLDLTVSEGYLLFTIRFQGSPSDAHNDGYVLPFATEFPSAGLWYVRVQLIGADTATMKVSLKTYLTHPIIHQLETFDYFPSEHPSLASDYTYYHIKTKAYEPLWISVVSVNKSEPNPNLLIRHNQLPTFEHYEVLNCNQWWCSTVRNIHMMAVPWSVDWFIAVASNTSVSVKNYRIWAGSSCPLDCTKGNRGGCHVGNLTGSCECRYGWIGFTCHESGGLPSDIISATIISSLIGMSLILALFMYCCCARDGDDYDYVWLE